MCFKRVLGLRSKLTLPLASTPPSTVLYIQLHLTPDGHRHHHDPQMHRPALPRAKSASSSSAVAAPPAAMASSSLPAPRSRYLADTASRVPKPPKRSKGMQPPLPPMALSALIWGPGAEVAAAMGSSSPLALPRGLVGCCHPASTLDDGSSAAELGWGEAWGACGTAEAAVALFPAPPVEVLTCLRSGLVRKRRLGLGWVQRLCYDSDREEDARGSGVTRQAAGALPTNATLLPAGEAWKQLQQQQWQDYHHLETHPQPDGTYFTVGQHQQLRQASLLQQLLAPPHAPPHMERQGEVHEGEGELGAGAEGSKKERGGRALPLAGAAAAPAAQAPSPPLPFPTPVAAPAPVPYLDPHTITTIFPMMRTMVCMGRMP